MSDILFVKTSSLGDIVHHMPALTEARQHYPQAHFSWVVEEAFAPLVKLHPAVDEVIPVASRRWRRALLDIATWRHAGEFVAKIRARCYAEVIDTQGLLRTALMARLARGRRHGYGFGSIREPLAAAFYDVRHRVDRRLHAIARNRILTGLALGYVPTGAIDFGLQRARFAAPVTAPYGLLLHSTARSEKEWPTEHWVALGQALASGLTLRLPWGTPAERERSERMAARIPQAEVVERRPLDEVVRLVAGAQFVVGVDTGLLHLAAALGVPLVGIFIGTKPDLTGPMGAGPIAVVGGQGVIPSVQDVVAALERVVKS